MSDQSPPDDTERAARELVDHLEEWRSRFEGMQSVAPEVQRQLETARWQAKNAPIFKKHLPEEVRAPISYSWTKMLEETRERFPLAPEYYGTVPPGEIVLTTSTASAAAANVSLSALF